MDILISSRHVKLLRDYSEKTGLSIDLCVHDALVEWFRKDAPVIFGSLGPPHSTRTWGGHLLTTPSGTACDGSDSGGIVRRISSLLRSKATFW
jgi:hypothetical protein